jgi:hypothetical protein
LRAKQAKQIHHGFQGIVDLVGNRRPHAAFNGDLLRCIKDCSSRLRLETSRKIFETLMI